MRAYLSGPAVRIAARLERPSGDRAGRWLVPSWHLLAKSPIQQVVRGVGCNLTAGLLSSRSPLLFALEQATPQGRNGTFSDREEPNGDDFPRRRPWLVWEKGWPAAWLSSGCSCC